MLFSVDGWMGTGAGLGTAWGSPKSDVAMISKKKKKRILLKSCLVGFRPYKQISLCVFLA